MNKYKARTEGVTEEIKFCERMIRLLDINKDKIIPLGDENNDGRIVQIIGKKRDANVDHTYTYELNYLVDRKNNTYTLYSAYKDGIKMNEIEELILKIKAFDLCDVDIKVDEENN